MAWFTCWSIRCSRSCDSTFDPQIVSIRGSFFIWLDDRLIAVNSQWPVFVVSSIYPFYAYLSISSMAITFKCTQCGKSCRFDDPLVCNLAKWSCDTEMTVLALAPVKSISSELLFFFMVLCDRLRTMDLLWFVDCVLSICIRVVIIKVFYLWLLRLIVPNVENLIRLTTL